MQVALPGVLEHSFRERSRAIHRYVDANKDRYVAYATLITPDVTDDVAVWSRVAFSILSANTGFRQAQSALGYALQYRGTLDAYGLTKYGMVPAKADYLNAIPDRAALIRSVDETWHEYRVRLQRTVKGLGLAKASFAACLLYPLAADLACVDTHMQKVYLGHTRFHDLRIADYLAVEEKVRKIARRHGVNTFLAQWMIWDHVRGATNDHDIFPGSHKDDPIAEW